MSHVAQPRLQPTGWIRAHRPIALAALLAFVAVAVVVLVLATGDNGPTGSAAGKPARLARPGKTPPPPATLTRQPSRAQSPATSRR